MATGDRIQLAGMPLLLVVLESNSRSEILETLIGPAVEQVVGRVTGYDAHVPDPPASPTLQPPKPPVPLPISETQHPVEPPPDENSTNTVQPPPTLAQPDPGSDIQPGESPTPTGPRVVYTRGGENLFELALEYYGKSNWTIVTKIRSENPQIKDTFAVFRERQRVVLPDLAPAYPWRRRSESPAHAKSSR